MTGLLRPSFMQTGIIGKTYPWQMALVIHQSSGACALLVKNVDFAFIAA
jgi:hypothetical protein